MFELSLMQGVGLVTAAFVVAFFYSSVGHGGATGYLVTLALLGTRLGSRRWSSATFSRVLAGVILFAGGKLLIEALIA